MFFCIIRFETRQTLIYLIFVKNELLQLLNRITKFKITVECMRLEFEL